MASQVKPLKGVRLTSSNFVQCIADGVDKSRVPSRRSAVPKVGHYLLTVGELVSLALNRKVTGYEWNRGKGKIVRSTIDRIAAEFKAEALDTLTFGLFNHSVPAHLVVGNGHNRFGGILMRAKNGKMTKNEWQETVAVRVVSEKDFIDTYQLLGACVGHSVGDKITNPDLLFGHCIQGDNGLVSEMQRLGMEDSDIAGMLKAVSRLTPLANILTAIHLRSRGELPEIPDSRGRSRPLNLAKATYLDVYKLRFITKRLASETKDFEFGVIRPDDYEKLAAACDYYCRYRKAVLKLKKDSPIAKDTRPMLSTGLLGLILTERMFRTASKREITIQEPETLARCMYFHLDVQVNMADLLGSNHANAKTTYRQLGQIAKATV